MWADMELNQLFDIGSSKRVLKSQWQQTGVPFYRGREVTRLSMDGFVDNELFISEQLYTEYADKYGVPKCGDIVITAIGTIGNSYIVQESDRFYFKDASVLWLKKTSGVSSEFINYWLKSSCMKNQLDEGNGATVDTLTIRKLQVLRLKLPALAEQKRIVAILDEAFAGIDAAIANTEKNLANARELFESYLDRMLSQRGKAWVEKPLVEFVASISTGPFGSLLHKSDYVSDGVPLVNPINIVESKVVPDYKKMVGDSTKKRLGAYILKAGDIVIGRRGEIGRCAVIEDAQDGWVCGTGCFFIRPSGMTNPHFIAHLLRSTRYRKELERISSGATMLNLSNKALSNLTVSVPEIREQERIVSQISDLLAQCKSVKSIYLQKLRALAELKQSLLQKALSGEFIEDVTEQKMDEAVA